MSFDDAEFSTASSEPIRLYEFARGSQIWRYCSGERDVTYNGEIYTSTPIDDDGIQQSGDTDADAVRITAPAELPVAQLYRGLPPTAAVLVTVRDYQLNEDDAVVIWIGNVYTVSFPNLVACEIICQSLEVGLTSPGLRLHWSRQCPYALYGRGCNVDKAEFAVEATISDVDGAGVEAAAFSGFADDYFTGGLIEWDAGDGNTESRAILSHTGNAVTLLGGTSGLEIDQVVTGYPGCNRTIEDCESRFDNRDNYGGVPGLPGRSPFDGNPLF